MPTMKILAIVNQKGGTGKSTTAAALSQAAAAQGKKALAIDLDPQFNLTLMLDADQNQGTSLELLEGTASADELIQHSPTGPDIIPASQYNTLIKPEKSKTRLKKALESLKTPYDLIVIDTPPTAGEFQYNALRAATGLLIPLYADIFSYQGLCNFFGTTMKEIKPELSFAGIILTRHEDRTTISRQMKANIISTAEKFNFDYMGAIRRGVAIQEAQALQKNLFEYAPKSKPALDYMELYKKIMEEK